MPKGDKLTLKQRKFLKEYLESGNATKAAMKVYDCTYHSARNIGSENLTKLGIKDEIRYWFDQKDMTDEKLLNKIKRLQDMDEWQAFKSGIEMEMKLKGHDKKQHEHKGEVKFEVIRSEDTDES